MRRCSALFHLTLLGIPGVGGYVFPVTIRSLPNLKEPVLSSTYGRGAEIWPECNEEPILLTDSFPNGVIPEIAQAELKLSGKDEPDVMAVVETPTRRRRRRVPRAIQRILRRAAVKEENVEYMKMTVDITPAVIALCLFVGGLVQPNDVLIFAFWSGYLSILNIAARGVRSDGVTPVLPSLPPQGHVPALVANPLGNAFTNSHAYDIWLQSGTTISVIGPILLLLKYFLSQEKQVEAATLCARPVFLLCCQAVSESISRKVMVSSSDVWIDCNLIVCLSTCG